jgi:glyoxylase-like metal-dependent hydrolase (beta-lactamase superfamily II)
MQDGKPSLPIGVFGPNAPEGAVNELLTENNLPVGDTITATINILLIDTGDQKILMDSGNGLVTADGQPSTSGKIFPTMEALGVQPGDITSVILSHYHPDHVNGVSDTQKAMFPNATYYVPQPEWDFLQAGAAGTPFEGIVQSANALLKPMADNDQLKFYGDEDEVVPGIQAIFTPGHTPGHMAFLVNSGSNQLICPVDVAIHSVASLQHPEWFFGFDADPQLAVETRNSLFGRAADEGIPVAAYHFPFPGVGYIDRDGDGFRYIPNTV